MFETLYEELKDKPFLNNKQEIINNLSEHLQRAITQKEKVGIAFSGGIDSSFLVHLSKDFKLYAVGLQNSQDLDWAVKIATKMHWPLKIKLVSLEEAEQIIQDVVHILQTDDVVKVGVGCVVYAVLQMAKKDKIKTVLGGLGSEEIFAGYDRHIDYDKQDFTVVQQRLWEGLADMEARDLSRDIALAKHFKINLIAPFLDKELVRYAMQIDPKLKINKEEKKIILRETAVVLGYPKEFAFRKKTAAQYGSKFDRAILRLAKKNGFKLKKDYLRSLL